MPKLLISISEESDLLIRARARSAGKSVSAYLADRAAADVAGRWSVRRWDSDSLSPMIVGTAADCAAAMLRYDGADFELREIDDEPGAWRVWMRGNQLRWFKSGWCASGRTSTEAEAEFLSGWFRAIREDCRGAEYDIQPA